MTSPALGVGAVLLAAGSSRRMGRPKLLLPWQGTSVLGHLVAQWQAAGAGQIAVVCASGDRPLEAELDRLGFPAADRIVNPAPDRGMFSSIQCAAQWPGWQPAWSHFAIALGDQPHLRQSTLLALLRFSAARPTQVCQPARSGRPRHPVVLPRAVFLELAQSPAARLKDFLASRPLAACEIDDPGLDWDLDSPADYAKALAARLP
jgi:molybdenum cofactor cytidylyltransferase